MNKAAERSPFKFLDSFTEADHDIFFGREHEVEEVYAKVFQSKILLIYGASGTGKSSIINCGLANKFMPSDWLQIPVRRGGDMLQSLAQQINKYNLSAGVEDPSKATSPKELKAALSSVFLDHFKPIYLVFDQFEELFIFGSREEWTSFTETMRYLLDSDLELRFIFIIRGEYLEFLAEFEDMIPGFFDNRVRIEKMTRSKARESIIGPCRNAGIEVEDGVADFLLEKLSPGGGRVELTFLQVFLDKLYKQAMERTPEGEALKFTNEEVERLGQMSDVLAEFVDEQLFKMDNTKLATAVLKAFVSLQGTKVPLTLEQVEDSLTKRGSKLDREELAQILQSLVNKRILKDQDDEGRYELRHDSLAQKIFEKISLQEKERLEVEQFLNLSLKEYQKRGTFLSEEDLIYIAPHQRKLNLSKEMLEFIELSRKRSNKQRRRRRNRAILTMVILLLSIASVVGFIYSSRQKDRADALAREALEKSEEAIVQKELADRERQKAIENENQAEQQAQIAEMAKNQAEEQSLIAREAKIRAEQDREAAIAASERAEASEAEAMKQSELAEEEKARAEHLRRLGLSRELAVRSARMTSSQIKAQLALASYSLNAQEQGYGYQAEIYEALRDAVSFNYGSDHFIRYQEGGSINDMFLVGNQVFLATDNGSLVAVTEDKESPVTLSSGNRSWNLIRGNSSGNLLAMGNREGDIALFDGRSGKLIWMAEKYLPNLRALHVNSDNSLIVLSDTKLEILSRLGASTFNIAFDEPMADMSTAGDLVWLLAESGKMYNLKNGVLSLVNDFGVDDLNTLAVNREGNQWAAGSESGMIYLLDHHNKILQLPGHRAAISSLDFNSNGDRLISGGFDRSARVWQLAHLDKSPIHIGNLPSWVSSVAFDNNESVWICTYGGKALKLDAEMSNFFELLCEYGIDEMSAKEWEDYLASDIDQFNPCDE